MTRLSEEEIEYLKYQIYCYRYNDPWIANKTIARQLDRSISTVNRYAREAEAEATFWNPHPRLKPYPDKKGALLLFKNKYKAFGELKDYPGVDYLCIYQGDWNLMATYNLPIDFSQFSGYMKTVAEGVRGTVRAPKVSYTSWATCFEKMENFLEQEKRIPESKNDCIPCYPDWDEEDWMLYYYFAYDLRRRFNDLRKRHPVSWRKFAEWKKNLTKHCTVVSNYYPGGLDIYNGLTMCFQTDYEQYMMNLFSLLPTTPLFYKIGDYNIVSIYHPRIYQPEFKIFEIISQLVDEEIVSDYMDGHGFIRWQREFID